MNIAALIMSVLALDISWGQVVMRQQKEWPWTDPSDDLSAFLFSLFVVAQIAYAVLQLLDHFTIIWLP